MEFTYGSQDIENASQMRENMKKSEERVGRKKAGRSKEQSPSHAEKGIFPTPGG